MKRLKTEYLTLVGSDFFKNSFKMGIGVVMSQLLNLLYIPLFTRIFAQDAYAIQGNFLSILNILFVFCSFGLVSAMAIPKRKERINLVLKVILQFSLVISIIFGLSLGFANYFFGLDLMTYMFKINSSYFYYLFPIALFARSIIFVYETRLSLDGKFFFLSITKILIALLYGISVYLFYLVTGDTKEVLVFGNIISYMLVGYLMYRSQRINFLKFNLFEVKYILKRFRHFVIYSLPNMLMNALSFSLPSILLLHYYGEDIAGDYALGLKVVSIPVALIVASLRSVYLKKIADLFKEEKNKFYPFIKRVLTYSHIGSFFVFSAIFLLAPYITTYGLGAEWTEAYIYIRLLCFWQFLLIGNSPLSIVFQIIEKQHLDFFREILLLLFRIFSIVGCFYLGYEGLTAVTMFVVAGFVFNILLTGMILYHSKKISNEDYIYG